jgi:thiamine-monophosphate kinase
MADPAGLGEDALIAKYFRPLAEGFPGADGLQDDAAAIEAPPGHSLVITTDALIAGVHFLADDDPADIAFKAVAVNVSDLAAKSAEPIAYSLALALPRGTQESWIARFADGLRQAQAAFHIALSGGDTTVSPAGPLVISVTAFGSLPHGRIVRRSGAKAGDGLYVSGTIGDAALGLKLHVNDDAAKTWPLGQQHRGELIDRYLRPRPRIELRHALQSWASAAMDISDGLAIDCARLCAASSLAARIESAHVPLSPAARSLLSVRPDLMEIILTGGDDYEILAALPPSHEQRFKEAAEAAHRPVTRIGELVGGDTGLTILGSDHHPLTLSRLGYDHRV